MNKIKPILLKIILFWQLYIMLTANFGFGSNLKAQGINLITPTPNNCNKWDIYELTFIHNDSNYSNPFWDVLILGSFNGPDTDVIKIEGFYYDKNTWKLRFSPTEEGIWSYNISFITNEGTTSLGGQFECLPSNNNHGFIRINPNNPYGFIYSDNTPLLLNGINGHTPAVTAAILGIPSFPPPADSLMTILMWQYLASKNINAYRLQMFHQDWAPPVMDWNQYEGHANLLLNSGSLDKYDINNARIIDKWFNDAAELGINLYPCLFTIHDDQNVFFFNQSPWDISNGGFYTNPNEMYSSTSNPGHDLVIKYVRYVVNRYAAYRNIIAWEYNNEWGKYTSVDWINSIDTVISNSDPYSRPHVVSYWGFQYSFDSELHNLPSNQIVDFHIYPGQGYNSVYTIDSLINQHVSFFYNNYQKPIVVGEFGSGGFENNIPSEEHYYDRVGYWATFISGGSALYWLRGDNTSTGIAYNLETLEWIKSFGDISSIINDYQDLLPNNNVAILSEDSKIRCYSLAGNNEIMTYFHNFFNHQVTVHDERVLMHVPDAEWEVFWYNLATGEKIDNYNTLCENGELALNIPPFNVDILLYLFTDDTVSSNTLYTENEDIIKIWPNPTHDVINIEITDLAPKNLLLEIIDLNGVVIHKQILNNDKITQLIDISRYSEGIYFLRIISNEFIITKKIIKNKHR